MKQRKEEYHKLKSFLNLSSEYLANRTTNQKSRVALCITSLCLRVRNVLVLESEFSISPALRVLILVRQPIVQYSYLFLEWRNDVTIANGWLVAPKKAD